jgi:hypothetical protein
MMKEQPKMAKTRTAHKQQFPPGWDEARVRKVLAHYENETEEEAVAEDEAAFRRRVAVHESMVTDVQSGRER